MSKVKVDGLEGVLFGFDGESVQVSQKAYSIFIAREQWRDARIAEQEAQIKTLQSDANSWQSGYDEGRRMGGKHCALTIGHQAQRIGELEGLLLRVQVSLSLDDTEWGYSGAEKYKLLADIRSALSAAISADCNDMANERNQLRAESAAIKAQEPVEWEVYYSDDDSFHTITLEKSLIECYSKMAYTIKPLYAAPVATPAPIPDADHSEDVRAMVLPDGYKLVPIMLTPEMITVDPYGMGYGRLHAVWSRLLSASPAPAADAGCVLEQAMYTLISIGYHENSGLVHELRQALAASPSAKGGE